ncbi:glycosyltransferase [Halarcobacter sp.]|uniref:glycosyltransferase n=1 Tax=Halarcobacter sp. TaxID=2321133 RepID=UPI003B00488D
MNDIKVCLVSDTVYDLNGVSRFIQDYCKEAKKHKKSFYVISSTSKKHYEEIENIFNIKPIFKIKMPFYNSLDLVIPNFFKIKNKIKELNPDLLHISTPGTVGLCALISAKILNIPVVGIYHTDFPSYMYKNTKSKFVKKITLLYLNFFYKRFTALFSRSCEYIDIIKKQLAFKEEDLYILKAGINIENFDKSYKNENIWEKYNIKKNDFKVLYVGRLSVEKNVDLLIKHWEKLKLKNAKLILVGDLEFELERKEELKNIVFLGRKQKSELSQIYASSDCFIFPSTTDTLGQVVLEALASALPVIVTNSGGPSSFVKNEFGYVIDINSFDEVKNSLEELSKKDDTYFKKSSNAYEYMRDKSISHSFLDFWGVNQRISI